MSTREEVSGWTSQNGQSVRALRSSYGGGSSSYRGEPNKPFCGCQGLFLQSLMMAPQLTENLAMVTQMDIIHALNDKDSL